MFLLGTVPVYCKFKKCCMGILAKLYRPLGSLKAATGGVVLRPKNQNAFRCHCRRRRLCQLAQSNEGREQEDAAQPPTQNNRQVTMAEAAEIPTQGLPQQVQMGNAFVPFAQHPNLFVKQTKKGCIQEMLGCEAKTEFKVATMEQKEEDHMYILEDTSFLNRLCLGGIRPWEMVSLLAHQ